MRYAPIKRKLIRQALGLIAKDLNRRGSRSLMRAIIRDQYEKERKSLENYKNYLRSRKRATSGNG